MSDDATDAKRYRWLRDRITCDVERREWIEEVGENRRGQILSELRREFFYHFGPDDSWYVLSGRVSRIEDVLTLDAAIDAEMDAQNSPAPMGKTDAK